MIVLALSFALAELYAYAQIEGRVVAQKKGRL